MRAYSHLLLLGAAIVLLASCNASSALKKAEQALALGEYYEAATQFRKAYMKTPTKQKALRAERALKAAECFRRINFSAKAIGCYQNAIRCGTQDSLATLHLAQMLQRQGDYKKAIPLYEQYLAIVPNDPLARAGLDGCKMVEQWKAHPSTYSVKKETVINGRRADYCPMIAGDEHEQLYLTSTRPTAQGDDISLITGMKAGDIFFTKKDDKGKWTNIEPVQGELNSEYDEGASCLSPDGKTMYLTRCTTDPSYPRYARIFASSRSDAAWSAPKELLITSDTLSSVAHPAVSPDGRYIYFTSDMPGGEGGLDLWRIELDGRGGVMGGVENLGPDINTAGNEMFPTFRPNGELYFSSDGHPGMGGLDLFVAVPDTIAERNARAQKKNDDTRLYWQIENLGVPMNSSGDDFHMTFEGLHNRGFFSTSRGDARGWDHIMSFEKPEVLLTVKGWVYERDGYELPEGVVYMVGNDGTNLKLSVLGDGSFTQLVNPLVSYVLLGTCKGYLNHKEELTVDTSSVSREYTLQFPLASISAPVLVRNVLYEFDSAELIESSFPALDSLVTLLDENPHITIELASHCDFRGRDAYNMALSQRRAESVVRYLISKNIPADRLVAVGYGESRPKVVSRKIAATHSFLHEGDTLTEAFITALPEEQREPCHALNRRTEFRVLRVTYGLEGK